MSKKAEQRSLKVEPDDEGREKLGRTSQILHNEGQTTSKTIVRNALHKRSRKIQGQGDSQTRDERLANRGVSRDSNAF